MEVIATPDGHERADVPVPMLIFGNGPIIDSKTRDNASQSGTIPGNEDMVFWGNYLARAAGLLHKKGVSGVFVPSGGRTGGEQYKSEAELLSIRMQENGVPADLILAENAAYDTPTNFLNLLNMPPFDKRAVDAPIDLLVSPFMVPRVNAFAKLFAVHVRNTFVSTEVLRYAARTTKDGILTDEDSLWDNKELTHLETVENINDDRYFLDKKGAENNPISNRKLKDSLWIRKALEYPERILSLVGQVKNEERMRAMLRIAADLHSPEKLIELGILDINADTATLREQLSKVVWVDKPEVVARWVQEELTIGWPPTVWEKYEKLMG